MLILKTQKKQMNKYIEQLNREREQQLQSQAIEALKKIELAEYRLRNKTYGICVTWELQQIERMKRYVKKWKHLPGSWEEMLENFTVINNSRYLSYIVDKKYL